jgi:hypothetical protein
MSSVAMPMPKPAGGRPPFGGPPTRTSFDAQPDDEGDPIFRRLTDSVQSVLHAAKLVDDETAEEGLKTVLRLIEQRKRSVQQELSVLRMMAPVAMPPLLTNMYVLDYAWDDNELERLYVRLLRELDDAAVRTRKFFRERSE